MRVVIGRLTKGLAALLGVILGIAMYYAGLPLFGFGLFLAVIGFGGRILARQLAGRKPVRAAQVIEVWILFAICLVAFSASLILWLSMFLPTVLTGDEAQVKAVSGALIGAVTTYFATIWTKEIQESGGPFSTAAAFKDVLQQAFETHARVPDRTSMAYMSIYDDRVPNGPNGWGRDARLQRARIIQEHLSGDRNRLVGET